MGNPLHDLLRNLADAFRPLRAESSAVRQFRESMQIDYWKWHDGVGYDLEILKRANAEERRQIETILIERGMKDWRDVEALGVLDTQRAREVLREALHCPDHAIRIAVLEYAPNAVTDSDRTGVLVDAIAKAEIGYGLAEALRLVKHYHPPAVIDALFLAVLRRPNPVLFTGMLLYVHGQAKSDFDYEQRPFFFRFQGKDRAEPFRELCARTGADPERYLQSQ